MRTKDNGKRKRDIGSAENATSHDLHSHGRAASRPILTLVFKKFKGPSGTWWKALNAL